MTALELADYMENTERWNCSGVRMQDCAEMLRKQAEAIKQLREALDGLLSEHQSVDEYVKASLRAVAVLTTTEEI